MYSTFSRESFEYICDHIPSSQLMQLTKGASDMPAIIVGKEEVGKLVRSATTEEGTYLAKKYYCTLGQKGIRTRQTPRCQVCGLFELQTLRSRAIYLNA